MEEPPYTFDAFLSDYAAMRHVLGYQHFTCAGDTIEIPADHHNPLVLQLGDYAGQHPAQPVNMGYFMLIMAYAQHHAAALNLSGKDVDCTNQPPARPAIFRAIHHFLFQSEPLDLQPPEAIRSLAETYEREQ